MYLSVAITDEIQYVLAQKFGYSPSMLRRSLQRIERMATLIVPHVQVAASRDPDDDRILECAVAAKADYLVTGDKALLNLHPFRRIQILRPRAFLDLKPWEP